MEKKAKKPGGSQSNLRIIQKVLTGGELALPFQANIVRQKIRTI